METLFIEKSIDYTGRELSPHWIYKNFKIRGSACVAFIGKCDVKLSEMVDIEDVIDNSPIYSEKMVNIIAELFNIDLLHGVFAQRLLVTIVKELIEKQNPKLKIERFGDDIFIGGKKASVSIATKSQTSVLIHFGINIVSKGAIIDVSSLQDDTNIVDFRKFAEDILYNFDNEMTDIINATCKVRAV